MVSSHPVHPSATPPPTEDIASSDHDGNIHPQFVNLLNFPGDDQGSFEIKAVGQLSQQRFTRKLQQHSPISRLALVHAIYRSLIFANFKTGKTPDLNVLTKLGDMAVDQISDLYFIIPDVGLVKQADFLKEFAQLTLNDLVDNLRWLLGILNLGPDYFLSLRMTSAGTSSGEIY